LPRAAEAPRRIARLALGGRVFHALLVGEDRYREALGDPIAGLRPIGPDRPLDGLTWLPPCRPSKIVGVGRNYRAHAEELGHAVPAEPLLFLKPVSALLPHQGAILLPAASARVDFEGELGIVIGRAARDVPESEAGAHIFGYTCVNDVTARDLQKRDVQFTRAKGFDTFCPVGPCVAAGLDPADLVVRTFVNGALRQSGAVRDMLVPPARLVSYISQVMTLEPGDLIATGTPEGVGPLAPGDCVDVVIEEIGRLSNRVGTERDARER
jgi:2-keto-4-pentenoate hydratase/2-oxohepta-3-ene-1,7-dioic acid hydratase in catechol pathway